MFREILLGIGVRHNREEGIAALDEASYLTLEDLVQDKLEPLRVMLSIAA